MVLLCGGVSKWVVSSICGFLSVCLFFKNTVNLFIHIARNPDRRFSSSKSQHFKMSPPFASSEGVSASGDRLQSDGVQDTHLLPHSELSRIRERMCVFALTHSHSPFCLFCIIFTLNYPF